MDFIFRFMFFGDVIGQPGLNMLEKWIPKLKKKYNIDAFIVNGENSTKKGKGITPKIMSFLRKCGVSVVTSGNHVWQEKEIYNYLNENTDLIRPANYPSICPGKGYSLFNINGHYVAVVNLQGRVFMAAHLDCPFKTAESMLTFLKTKTKIILVDFHAEATSEKQVFASYLDGKVSAVLGTHTHVQTADERILANGSAYISDVGFCGALNSSLGMKTDIILKRFLTQMPVRFTVETIPPFVLNGVYLQIDVESGKALSIERINIIDNDM
ncbi:TIGR00282 family metallophosphoesterase [Candidatus Dependentiae bacterium]|nr:TIGR00282 family metallophosphoesterase [Candidatus Dependentiae bacterium]